MFEIKFLEIKNTKPDESYINVLLGYSIIRKPILSLKEIKLITK